MNPQIKYALIAVLLLVTACKKDKYSDIGRRIFLVRNVTGQDKDGNTLIGFDYSYDNNHRLTSIIFDKEPSVFSYHYSTVIRKYPYGGKSTYLLNSDRLADSANHTNAHTDDIMASDKWVYNAEGQPILYKSYRRAVDNDPTSPLTLSYEEVYEYSQGNLMNSYTYQNNVLLYRYEYTYDQTKINTVGNTNIGQYFLGKSSSNPMSSMTIIFDSIRLFYQYENHVNSKGCIDTIKSFQNGTYTGAAAYAYY